MKRCHYCKKWIPFWWFWLSQAESIPWYKEVGSGYDNRLRSVHYTYQHIPDNGTDERDIHWYHKPCYYKDRNNDLQMS